MHAKYGISWSLKWKLKPTTCWKQGSWLTQLRIPVTKYKSTSISCLLFHSYGKSGDMFWHWSALRRSHCVCGLASSAKNLSRHQTRLQKQAATATWNRQASLFETSWRIQNERWMPAFHFSVRACSGSSPGDHIMLRWRSWNMRKHALTVCWSHSVT